MVDVTVPALLKEVAPVPLVLAVVVTASLEVIELTALLVVACDVLVHGLPLWKSVTALWPRRPRL